MKKLTNLLMALILLLTCVLTACTGNTTESTPDNASSNIDITADTESSINDVSDNSIQQEESSLTEDNSKEPSVNDSFSMDKVVWYPKDQPFDNELVDYKFGFNEDLSYGLLKHAAEHLEEDIWYPVYIEYAFAEYEYLFYDYGCIIDTEYTELMNDIYNITEDSLFHYEVCYVTAGLLLELEKVGYPSYYTWMPHPDEVEERWKSATTAP